RRAFQGRLDRDIVDARLERAAEVVGGHRRRGGRNGSDGGRRIGHASAAARSCCTSISPPPTCSSQPQASCVLPLNRPKKASWISAVIGPRPPLPICRPSIERIGVISQAVPVKKA